ncbi:acylphosphatase [Candidatus Peregrinibacteria bacterium]|nr:acylphosphatase [Candidatus Peregrinibacteria bacterium]
MIRVHLTISGRVQGVFFRAHTQEKAEELGVKGWVANEADGTVSVVAEGPENKVNNLVDWCHGGPSTSQVEKVEIDHAPYMEEFDDFHIRY